MMTFIGKKRTVLFAVLIIVLCGVFAFPAAYAEDTENGILTEENWSGNVSVRDGKVLLTENCYSTYPVVVTENYVKLEIELLDMGVGNGDTWACFSLICKPMQVSPAGAVNSYGLYTLLYNFDGQLTVGFLHKSPLGEEYFGLQDKIVGADPAIGKHTIEYLINDDNGMLDMYIDGIQYKKALLAGIYSEDLLSANNETFVSYACFGGGVRASLLSVSAVNNRDMTPPTIVSNLETKAVVGQEFLLHYPTVTDNADESLAVSVSIYDPDGLKIFPKNNRFTPSVAGDYKILYYVIDSSGNEKSLSVTVTAEEAKKSGCASSAFSGIFTAAFISLIAIKIRKV
ncbi:MAG: hypothetical protein ACI4S9_06820 [Christensenellales bacterium]